MQCSAKEEKVDYTIILSYSVVQGVRTVSVLHIGPNLTHRRGSGSGGMLEIWRGHSVRLMHGHSRGPHARANDWHGCYSRLWRGTTAPWNRILGWGAKGVPCWRTFSSPILKQLAPYLLLYIQIINNNISH